MKKKNTLQGRRIKPSATWTKANMKAADKDGWNIYMADEGLQIQRNDEDRKFDSDNEAWAYICYMASAKKSKLHEKALSIIKRENYEEYKRITS